MPKNNSRGNIEDGRVVFGSSRQAATHASVTSSEQKYLTVQALRTVGVEIGSKRAAKQGRADLPLGPERPSLGDHPDVGGMLIRGRQGEGRQPARLLRRERHAALGGSKPF